MEVGGARVLSVNETYITSQGTDAARGKGRTGKEQEIRRQKKECEWDPVSERREADTSKKSVRPFRRPAKVAMALVGRRKKMSVVGRRWHHHQHRPHCRTAREWQRRTMADEHATFDRVHSCLC